MQPPPGLLPPEAERQAEAAAGPARMSARQLSRAMGQCWRSRPRGAATAGAGGAQSVARPRQRKVGRLLAVVCARHKSRGPFVAGRALLGATQSLRSQPCSSAAPSSCSTILPGGGAVPAASKPFPSPAAPCLPPVTAPHACRHRWREAHRLPAVHQDGVCAHEAAVPQPTKAAAI